MSYLYRIFFTLSMVMMLFVVGIQSYPYYPYYSNPYNNYGYYGYGSSLGGGSPYNYYDPTTWTYYTYDPITGTYQTNDGQIYVPGVGYVNSAFDGAPGAAYSDYYYRYPNYWSYPFSGKKK